MRLRLGIDLRYNVGAGGADFIFNIQAARTRRQAVVSEDLRVSQPALLAMHTDAATQARCLRLRAATGPLQVSYAATVDISHHVARPETVPETPIANLPPEALVYLYPSRYCPSDRMTGLALREFGLLPHGYARVEGIQNWVRSRVRFQSNSSNSMTSALDTLADGVGVCRDFAHLMISLCRALNIPARFSTGIDYGADPLLGPTDFHAFVEVYLGHAWYLFDPSGTAIPMGFMRIGTGRDAADASFATIFGDVSSQPPRIDIEAVQDPAAGWLLPQRGSDALSTDDQGLAGL